jgi:hypothetical protein
MMPMLILSQFSHHVLPDAHADRGCLEIRVGKQLGYAAIYAAAWPGRSYVFKVDGFLVLTEDLFSR